MSHDSPGLIDVPVLVDGTDHPEDIRMRPAALFPGQQKSLPLLSIIAVSSESSRVGSGVERRLAARDSWLLHAFPRYPAAIIAAVLVQNPTAVDTRRRSPPRPGTRRSGIPGRRSGSRRGAGRSRVRARRAWRPGPCRPEVDDPRRDGSTRWAVPIGMSSAQPLGSTISCVRTRYSDWNLARYKTGIFY